MLPWQIRKRPHIYEFSDHGGLILLAEHATSGATDELWFSRDEGLCFEGPVVLPQPMYIENIRVEPKSRSHVFVAHGLTTNDRGLSVATLVTVDLRRLLGNAVYPLCSQVHPLAPCRVSCAPLIVRIYIPNTCT
jgi:hypothetical protein